MEKDTKLFVSSEINIKKPIIDKCDTPSKIEGLRNKLRMTVQYFVYENKQLEKKCEILEQRIEEMEVIIDRRKRNSKNKIQK